MYKLTCRQFFKLTFVFVLLLSGCRQSEPTANPATEPPATPTAKPIPSSPLTEAFPGEGSIEDWTPAGELEVYDSETIFQLVNGQADFFFLYGFEQVAVRRYKNVEEVVLDIHIWQVLSPEDSKSKDFSFGFYLGPDDEPNQSIYQHRYYKSRQQ